MGLYSTASLQPGQAGRDKRRVMEPGAAFIVGDILPTAPRAA
jgi:penicillin-binding protein 1C